VLPNPNQTVTFVNGAVAYCASVEQDLNTQAATDAEVDCEFQQARYKKACKCDAGIQLPSNPPTPVLSEGGKRRGLDKIQVILMLGTLSLVTFDRLL
jgi:hypothetical protein